MEVRYVPARVADAGLLLVLMREFYEHEHLAFAEAAARRALHQILTSEALGRIWLIECEGEIAGYAVLTFGFSLEFHGRDAFVDELYLREAYRGRGIGRQLLEFLAATCRDLGIAALHLEVERANTRAQHLYRRAGFADHDRYLLTRWIAQ